MKGRGKIESYHPHPHPLSSRERKIFCVFENLNFGFVSLACAKPRLAGRRQGFRYSNFGFHQGFS
jgi:hypothetical protein